MAKKTAQVRVLIADDQTLFRSGLARLLEEDPRISLVGLAADGLEALAKTVALKPDVILMDLHMPGLDGVEATKMIGADHPEVKILILSTFDADTYVIKALRAGARGYVLKDAEADAIVSSIMAVNCGERVMAGAVANRMLDLLTGGSPSNGSQNVLPAGDVKVRAQVEHVSQRGQHTLPTTGNGSLTPRERQVLSGLCKGATNKELAKLVKLKPNTVRTHMQNIFTKLGVHSRLEAVTLALRLSLTELDDGGTTDQFSRSMRQTP